MSTSTIPLLPAGSVRMERAVRKFHVSLNVSNLARSIAFYRELFGVEPAKAYDDYAKFELEEPPVVLSLVPRAPVHGGNLNHAGVRVRGSEELVEMQHRLEAAGFRTRREEGVECCYALQTKFWVTDPDQVLWEVYVFHEDIDRHGFGSATGAAPAQGVEGPSSTTLVWEHRIGAPLPERIPYDDNTLQEVRLEGALNLALPSGRQERLLADALRVLRPGCEIRIRGLAGDREFLSALPSMPGPAAAVERVPSSREVADALMTAGFVDIRFEKLSEKAYFTFAGVRMREFALVARKPGFRPAAASHQVVYLGPMASVSDDAGNVFQRGALTSLNVHDWQLLQNGTSAAQFLFVAPDNSQG